jgi:hypothetical protein
LYFVPYGRRPLSATNVPTFSGLVVRYDTAGGFGASMSWDKFDLTSINAAATGFLGGAFDGRYVYFVPYYNGAPHGTLARYDTMSRLEFKDAGSWETFDLTTVNPSAKGYATAAFDGRYIYLAPYHNGDYHGIVARYDTQRALIRDSWELFDMSTVNPAAKGYLGSTFDGRYVYFAPYVNGTTAAGATYSGIVMRFDTRAAGGLSAPASWTSYDLTKKSGAATGFRAAAFDGRHVYFVQFHNAADYSGLVARVDTNADFKADASWSIFNVAANVNTNARGFIGATFDGQYLYLVPHHHSTAYHGIAVRYDTKSDFLAASSWSQFNAGTFATGFFGAGFDGRNVYLVPHRNPTPHGVVVQFDAKSPAWLPLRWNAGFN